MSTERIHIDQYRNETGQTVMLHGVLKLSPQTRIYHSSFESAMQLGQNTQVGPDVHTGAYFTMGEDCYIARANVGRYVSIGGRVAVNPFAHPVDWLSISEFQYHPVAWDWMEEWKAVEKLPRSSLFKYVTIGNDVWMGHNVNVMGNTTIGDGAIVAASAVVTHDVPPYAIVGGVPARLIRYRFPDRTIERLVAVRWWDLPLIRLSGLPFNDIEGCLDRLEEMRRTDESLQSQ
jgi:acetyltransferase-like isoleucine patch superfamily enzyme